MTKPPTAPLPWSPDQPLRADATDTRIIERAQAIYAENPRRSNFVDTRWKVASISVAREFAAACVEDARRASPAAPEVTPEMVGEMVKQASLGHKRFCVGVHTHESGEEEWEWIDWKDAFAKLTAALASGGAPHPDTVRLDWLEVEITANRLLIGHTHINANAADLRAAIDAARGEP